MGLSFYKMWDLVYEHHTDYYTIFTEELMMAVFWEESLFDNRRQIGWKAGAVGYGQVEPSSIWLANAWAKRDYAGDSSWQPQDVLVSERKAVQVSGRLLARYYEHFNSRQSALNAYAGAPNLSIPPRWLACENALLALGRSWVDSSADEPAIKAALKLAKPNSDPDVAFP
jgi:hypothetical protein